MVQNLDEDLRRRILEVAQQMFLDRGINLSTLEIASALGISKTTLYQAYPSKDALLQAVLEKILAHWITKIRAFATAEDFGPVLQQGLAEISAFMKNITPAFLLDLRKYHPAVFQEFISQRDRAFQSVFETAYQAYAARGLLKPSVDKVFLLRFVLHAVDLLHDREFMERSGFKTDEVLAQIIEVLLNGIMQKPPV